MSISHMTIEAIESMIGYKSPLDDRRLAEQALTRPCYAKERKDEGKQCESQEYLAFLGDAILRAVLSELLIEAGLRDTGVLTKKRADLENGNALAGIAKGLGIGRELIRAKTMDDEEWARSEGTILAETVEALIGAIYLVSGYSEARNRIEDWYESQLPEDSSS